MTSIDKLYEAASELQARIGYSYEDKRNLILALTHSSYANENRNEKMQSNERLEFLGDAILNVVISEFLYINYPELTEGEMTKARANIVCEQSLMKCSNDINVGSYLLLGKGEENTGGRQRTSILSDAFEALIGSIYIDSGLDNAKRFIIDRMKGLILDSIKGIISLDYKTQLQERVQKASELKITYEIVEEKGPDHSKIFISQVRIGDKALGRGEGRSKKEAEQNAAKATLGMELPK